MQIVQIDIFLNQKPKVCVSQLFFPSAETSGWALESWILRGLNKVVLPLVTWTREVQISRDRNHAFKGWGLSHHTLTPLDDGQKWLTLLFGTLPEEGGVDLKLVKYLSETRKGGGCWRCWISYWNLMAFVREILESLDMFFDLLSKST